MGYNMLSLYAYVINNKVKNFSKQKGGMGAEIPIVRFMVETSERK